MDDIVQLNVGGSHFTTTKKTLLREENSIFTQILYSTNSEDYGIIQLHDGSYFIDRNGKLFALLLDYLRSGKLILPEKFRDFERLKEEAIFFRLKQFEQQLALYYSQRISNEQTTTSNHIANRPTSNAGKAGEMKNARKLQIFFFPEHQKPDSQILKKSTNKLISV